MPSFVVYRTKPIPLREKIRYGRSGEKFDCRLPKLRGKKPCANGRCAQAAAGMREMQTCTASPIDGADRRDRRKFRIRRRKFASAGASRHVGGLVRPVQVDRTDRRITRPRTGRKDRRRKIGRRRKS